MLILRLWPGSSVGTSWLLLTADCLSCGRLMWLSSTCLKWSGLVIHDCLMSSGSARMASLLGANSVAFDNVSRKEVRPWIQFLRFFKLICFFLKEIFFTRGFDDAAEFRQVTRRQKLAEAARRFGDEDAVDDVQDAVGGHDIACDDLLTVDVQFALQIAFHDQRRAQHGRGTRTSLDHSRADHVGQQMLFQHTCQGLVSFIFKKKFNVLNFCNFAIFFV